MARNRIRKIRKEKGLTLQQVSDKTGISVSSLSAYEKQKGEKGYRYPKIDNWMKLADFFNVPVSYLQGESDIADKDAFKSARKWLNAFEALRTDEKQNIKETDALSKENTLYVFSLLFNAIINSWNLENGENERYTKLKDNISSVDSLSDINFVTSEVFRIALEAKNGKRGAEKIYNKIHGLVSNYDYMFYDFYHHK